MAVFTYGTKECGRIEERMNTCKIPFAELAAALQHHEAIIAGGSMLQCVTGANFGNNDIDVYVPIRHAVSLIKWLESKSYQRAIDYCATGYGSSFLYQNGIKKVIQFNPDTDNKSPIQIMTVRNKRTPLKVVESFDLTCCMCWFDGIALRAPDYANIMQKTTTLSWQYAEKVYQDNEVLIRRLHKYMNRGLEIIPQPRPDGKPYPMPLRDFLTVRQAYIDIITRSRDIPIVPEIDYPEIKWPLPEGPPKRLHNSPEMWREWMNKFVIGLMMNYEPAATLSRFGFSMDHRRRITKEDTNKPWEYLTPEQEAQRIDSMGNKYSRHYQHTECEDNELYLEKCDEETSDETPEVGAHRVKYLTFKHKRYADDGYDSDDYDSASKITDLIVASGHTLESVASMCSKLASLKPMAPLRWVLSKINGTPIGIEDNFTHLDYSEHMNLLVACSSSAGYDCYGGNFLRRNLEIDRVTRITVKTDGYRLIRHPASKPFEDGAARLASWDYRPRTTESRLIILPNTLMRKIAVSTLQNECKPSLSKRRRRDEDEDIEDDE